MRSLLIGPVHLPNNCDLEEKKQLWLQLTLRYLFGICILAVPV